MFFLRLYRKKLREINSECDYKIKCFESESSDYIKNSVCPAYQDHNFVSAKECERAGLGVMDLVTGKTEVALPIRNQRQDVHNDRIYDLELKKLEAECERDNRECKNKCSDQNKDCLEEKEKTGGYCSSSFKFRCNAKCDRDRDSCFSDLQ